MKHEVFVSGHCSYESGHSVEADSVDEAIEAALAGEGSTHDSFSTDMEEPETLQVWDAESGEMLYEGSVE